MRRSRPGREETLTDGRVDPTCPGILGPRLTWERLPGQVGAIAPGKAALASHARRVASCTARAVIIDKITGNCVDIGTEGMAIPDAPTRSQSRWAKLVKDIGLHPE